MTLQVHASQSGDGSQEREVEFDGFADVLRVGKKLGDFVVLGCCVLWFWAWLVRRSGEDGRQDGLTTAALSSHFALLRAS